MASKMHKPVGMNFRRQPIQQLFSRMDNIKRILAFFLWFQTILDRLRQLHHKKKLGIEIVGP